MPVILTAVAQPGAILHRTQMVILSKTGHQSLVCTFSTIPSVPDSFHSGRWNTTSNPDLAFVNLDGPAPSRIILDHFPKSQHRPSLIISESPISSIPSKPVKRWNFRKANWTQFVSLVDSGVDDLPPSSTANLDQAYSSVCNLLISAAKPPFLAASASATSHYGMMSALPIKISSKPNLETKMRLTRHHH